MELLEAPPPINERITEFTWDPAPIESWREAVACAIAGLSAK